MTTVNSPISLPQRPAPVLDIDGIHFAIYWFQWFTELVNKLNALFVTATGQATLVAGVATVALSGVTTANQAFVSLVTGGGTLGQYQGVCTTGTLTITSLQSNNTTQTADTSTVNYVIYSN